jgi:hypothetical protein
MSLELVSSKGTSKNSLNQYFKYRKIKIKTFLGNEIVDESRQTSGTNRAAKQRVCSG